MDRRSDRDEAIIAALRAGMRADSPTQGLRWFTEELAERGFSVVSTHRFDTLAATELTAAEQGTRLMRARWALQLIRKWCIGNAYNATVCLQMRDWIDAGGAAHPVPWPDSPFAAEWAREQGWTPSDGSVSVSFTIKRPPTDA